MYVQNVDKIFSPLLLIFTLTCKMRFFRTFLFQEQIFLFAFYFSFFDFKKYCKGFLLCDMICMR